MAGAPTSTGSLPEPEGWGSRHPHGPPFHGVVVRQGGGRRCGAESDHSSKRANSDQGSGSGNRIASETPPPLTVGPSSTVVVLRTGSNHMSETPVPQATVARKASRSAWSPTTQTLSLGSTPGTSTGDVVSLGLSFA